MFKILDLGCGSGAAMWYLAREGFTTYGIDASPAAIKKAKKRLQKKKLHAAIKVGDFITLPYSDESMDAIIDAASIQHNSIQFIRKIFTEIYRVLKKDGKFFGMLIANSRDLNCADYKTHYFKKSEIKTLLKKFKKVSVDHLTYTEENGTKLIKFWLVEATR